jgi:hypothetical protein
MDRGDLKLGVIAVDLARSWPSWMNRRVETIEYVEDTTVRRTTSFDLTMPAETALAATVTKHELIYLPLQVLAKWAPLMHVQVADEAGSALSMVTRARAQGLTRDALKLMIGALYRERFKAEMAAHLTAGLEHLAAPGVDDTTGGRDAFVRHRDVRELEPRLIGLLDELGRGYLQLIQLRYEPGAQRVVTVAVDRAQPWQDEATLVQQTRRALGAGPRFQRHLDLEIAQAQRFHVEVLAPAQMEIVDAEMRVQDARGEADRGQPPLRARLVRSRTRAHLSLDPASLDPTQRRGAAIVAVMPRAEGVPVTVTVSSVLTAGVLVSFWIWQQELDRTTAAAVLVVLPAVGAYLAQAGEHPYATRGLRLLRRLALVVSLCGIATATMIAAGLLTPERAHLAPAHAPVAHRIATGRVLGLRCRFRLTGAAPWPRIVAHGHTTCHVMRASVRPRRGVARLGPARIAPARAWTAHALAGVAALLASILVLAYFSARWFRRSARRKDKSGAPTP